MTRLSGWLRIGIVLSGMWILVVLAYTAFEFFTFPIGPFDTRSEYPSDARPSQTTQFFFVGVVQAPWKDREPQAAAYARREAEAATSVDARKVFLAVLEGTEYRAGLLPLFYAVLFGGLVAMWALALSSIYVLKWVRAGFPDRGGPNKPG
jgi:hypothetical protein